jgi:hypothetical protein
VNELVHLRIAASIRSASKAALPVRPKLSSRRSLCSAANFLSFREEALPKLGTGE